MASALRVLAVAASGMLAQGFKLSNQSQNEVSSGIDWAMAMEMLAEDAEDDASEEAAEASSDLTPLTGISFSADMNGFQRAQALNQCAREFRQEWGSMPIVKRDLKAVYFLEGKSGSSTIRDALRQNGPGDHNYKDLFKFTVVRDPLARLISVFWEEGRGCAGLDTKILDQLKAEKPQDRAKTLKFFENFVTKLEKGDCWGPHATIQRRRLPDPKEWPLDFVGSLSHLKDDWKAIAQHQASKFQVKSWPELSPPQRVSVDQRHWLLNTTLLPAGLAQRSCNLYREDYCCFKMPVPHPCFVDCSK